MNKKDAIFKNDDICIIGMAGEFPKAGNIAEYWQNLVDGRCCITRNRELDSGSFVSAFGVLDGLYRFDSEFFGISDFDAEKMDVQQRKLIENVYLALENAGYADRKKDSSVTGIICSAHAAHYVWEDYYINRSYEKERGSMIGMYNGSAFASRIAYLLNLTGPSLTVDCACASSGVDIEVASACLRAGECRQCVVAAASVLPSQQGYYKAENALSADGCVRPFDKNGTGFVPGSAAAAVVLKRYADAVEDNDEILAVIKGSYVCNDGSRKVGFAAPSVQGEYEAVSNAMKKAGAAPGDIGYVECHGTATPLGDAIEITALKKVFKGREGKCGIGSVKSNIGHTDTVSGLSGIIKVICSFRSGIIPRSIGCDEENEEIKPKSPVFVVKENIMWDKESVKLALVNSFGVGGINASIVLQEPPERASVSSSSVYDIIPLSAKNEASLKAQMSALKSSCTDTGAAAWTFRYDRPHFNKRTYLVNDNGTLKDGWGGIREAVPARKNKLLFIFPGGGSQFTSMGRELYAGDRLFREKADICMEVMQRTAGIDLRSYITGARETDSFSIAEGLCLIFMFSYAAASELISLGAKPDYLLGESFGEYAAACISGVLTLEDAVRLIAARGELLEKTEPGAMLGISAERGAVERLIAGTGAEISAVNFINRITVSGTAEDVELVRKRAEEENIYVSVLPVSRAGHSSLLNGILGDFEKAANDVSFGKMAVPVISSCEGGFVAEERIASAGFWVKNLSGTSEFYSAVSAVSDIENLVIIEVGTGTQLSSFASKILNANTTKRVIALVSESSVPERLQFNCALGELWACGADIDWDRLYADRAAVPDRSSVPGYCFGGREFRHELRAPEAGSSGGSIAVFGGLGDSNFEKSRYIVTSGCERTVFVEPRSSAYLTSTGADRLFAEKDSLLSAITQKYFASGDITPLNDIPGYKELADKLCAACIMDHFRLCPDFDENGVYTSDKLIAMLGVVPVHHPFIRFFIRFMCDYGYASDDCGLVTFTERAKALSDKRTVLEECHNRLGEYTKYMDFCVRVSDSYDDAFRGKIDSGSVLYPGGSMDTVIELHKSMESTTFNRRCIEALAEIVRKAAEGSDRPLRILEVGGGTGELTDPVLGALEGLEISYCFTDIGNSFVAARNKLDSEQGRSFVSHRVLDISSSPSKQGFAESSFDIIICLDVVQATADIRRTLGNIAYLLADGGMFGMAQTCGGNDVTNMIFGFAPGWWNYENDPERDRITMSEDKWRAAMTASGFRDVMSFPENMSSDCYVFAMRAPEECKPGEHKLCISEYERNYRRLSALSDGVSLTFADISSAEEAEALAGSLECACVISDRRILSSDTVSSSEPGDEGDDEKLTAIVKDILGVERVSFNDRLADIGFDSLSGLILCSRLKESFGVELGLNDLSGCDRISDIMELVSGSDSIEMPAVSTEPESSAPSKNIDDLISDMGL